MSEAMTWILVGVTTLGAFAFTVLNAWLVLKIVLNSFTRGSGPAGKTGSIPDQNRVRNRVSD